MGLSYVTLSDQVKQKVVQEQEMRNSQTIILNKLLVPKIQGNQA